MATTHVLAGIALALLVAPEAGVVVVAAAALGGVVPDLDLLGAHRRTLHYPVLGVVAAGVAGAVAVAVPSTATLALALFVASAALHAASDALGGGLELRPWEGTSEEAVYSHAHGRWLRPRRLVRYDGAPEDLLVAVALAVPVLAAGDELVRWVAVALVAASAVYVALRRPMVDLTESAVASLPADVVDRLPDVVVEDFR